jgi:Cyclic nucleotide-binding domain
MGGMGLGLPRPPPQTRLFPVIMGATAADFGFIVWGVDQAAYGPVELPTLVSWVKDERVTSDSWVFSIQHGSWRRAGAVPELQMFFSAKPRALEGEAPPPPDTGFKPRMLRRVKILSGLAEEQLERFASFAEVEKVPQWAVIVKQGDHGDAMYLILEGELRVRIEVGGKETILTTLGPGDFFGDISLLDQGPRSADVVANVDSLVVKLSAAAFEKLAAQAPDIATPFLLAVGKTLTARIRADNKRFGDSVKFRAAM